MFYFTEHCFYFIYSFCRNAYHYILFKTLNFIITKICIIHIFISCIYIAFSYIFFGTFKLNMHIFCNLPHASLPRPRGAASGPPQPLARPLSTISAARNTARALTSVSCHSFSGTESKTTPAAACTLSMPSLSTPVRMAMATSISPE